MENNLAIRLKENLGKIVLSLCIAGGIGGCTLETGRNNPWGTVNAEPLYGQSDPKENCYIRRGMNGRWRRISKEEYKKLFREGKLRIIIPTGR